MTANISFAQDPQSVSAVEGESQELIEVLQRIVYNVNTFLEIWNCSVALLDVTGKTLVTLATLHNDGTSFPMNEGIVARVVEHRVPLVINDMSCNPQELDSSLTGSVMCVPLMDADHFIGILTASSQKANTFDEQKIQLLTVFAEQAVLAVTKAQLLHKANADATRMKSHFLSLITHELRSPLNAINGYLDLALAGNAGELNEQLCEFLQRARASSEYLYVLIEDLLLLSRADGGQLRLNSEVISLQDIVTNAVEEMELTASDRRVSLTVDAASTFPQLFADPVRLQQVLRNLISNALRFTAAGGKVTISAHVEQTRNRSAQEETPNEWVVKIKVCDSGCGIAPEQHQRIFEPFYQVVQNKGMRMGGQGLGLAIVKKIVELHNGEVTVESTLEQGSVFTCTFPRVVS